MQFQQYKIDDNFEKPDLTTADLAKADEQKTVGVAKNKLGAAKMWKGCQNKVVKNVNAKRKFTKANAALTLVSLRKKPSTL